MECGCDFGRRGSVSELGGPKLVALDEVVSPWYDMAALHTLSWRAAEE